ncbi:hypothetical protein L861_04060 [Litchfieldella anticariensis FP35 = DSM 16096]|uniref:DUF1853 domain-containing protein n=1 Tax=Litchfieldella anticariensis (strain DSM 16096 / CECT 5854 / CIP 108499 / LMG 22089 / FP35) TaxID=1121939 RepID=S2KV88_LITA3|nr:DUF1853 family protein [Halomonas anticariensis]EPC04508.1 hypothetical protein L861_04060 [Halomonas anticariensis FP35 = DSM 16096]
MCQTPDQRLHPLWERYHHPLVRDLAWLLETPDVLESPGIARPGLKELGLDGRALAAWLDALEQAPHTLGARIGSSRRGRLGHYHERLWQFLLAEAPGTHLLAHNLPIIEDKRTLGELDLLYRNSATPAPIHLEVAIKFYLGLPEGPGEDSSQARWIGPGCADSLAIKYQHLQQHQLPLVYSPQARRLLSDLLDDCGDPTSEIKQRLALPGVLFYPWQHDMSPPQGAHANHLRGEWLTWRCWPAFRYRLPANTRGCILRKPHWLALPPHTDLYSLSDLSAQLVQYFNLPRAPLLLGLHSPEIGWSRVFVAGNEWPYQIPLPPIPTLHSP